MFVFEQVQSLQQWKSQVLSASSQDQVAPLLAAHAGHQVSDSQASSLLSTTQQLIETLEQTRWVRVEA